MGIFAKNKRNNTILILFGDLSVIIPPMRPRARQDVIIAMRVIPNMVEELTSSFN